MAKITGFRCVDEKEQDVPCYAYGNNVAFNCPKCGSPMLAVIRKDQRGSKPDNLTPCEKGDFSAWMSADFDKKLLTLRQVNPGK
jgi:predicted RNA-binding Zn-ribbon protein involved in translation (DUF1610 family)